MISEKKSLENALLNQNLIAPEQLDHLKIESRRTEQPLMTLIAKKGILTEEAVARALSGHLSVPYIELDHYYIDQEALRKVPEELARAHLLVPLFLLDETLTIAMADPFDVFGIDEVKRTSNCEVNLAVATNSAIIHAIESSYKMTDKMKEVMDVLSEEMAKTDVTLRAETERLLTAIEENPVVKLVNLLINQAIRDRASDIHIEPTNDAARVRYRIDGVLNETLLIPKHLHGAITSRLKVLAGMNIAEKRIAQDGHIEIKKENMDIDLRVATYPTIWGEKIVIRILNRAGISLGLQELGFEPEELVKFQQLIKQPHGLILTTGPTGSGKTTTLYAALNTVNTMERNIITIEDPVEYRLNLVNQSQVNPLAGLTFASGLRAILRQDPDIIMVGEIRDVETAQLAIHASLTGHLVFSSLHTNDAPSTATRLIDMEIEPYLVASTLICAIGQRLVRLLCPRCKEPYPADLREKACFRLPANQEFTFYRPNGCRYCKGIGYTGRRGLFEIMLLNEDIRSAIVTKQPSSIVRQLALRNKMASLRQAGFKQVLAGFTTVAEVMRVSLDEETAVMGL